MDKIRWGICGSGAISSKFVSDLKLLEDASVTSVCSRVLRNAGEFGERYGIAERFSDYNEFLMKGNFDIVYLGVPNNLHYKFTTAALESGKAVLCEKPFALNRKQAEEMVNIAEKKGLFLMEAIWTHFFPVMEKTRDIIKKKKIGGLRQVVSDFGFRAPYDPKQRLFNPDLGGGAMLDVGIYNVSLALKLIGRPVQMEIIARTCPTGVDDQEAVIFKSENGALAVLSSSVSFDTPQEALILGDSGNIRIHSPWWKPSALTLSTEEGKEELFRMPYEGFGYHFEAKAVMDSLRKGEKENVLIPHKYSLEIMDVLDEFRRRIGVRYPGE